VWREKKRIDIRTIKIPFYSFYPDQSFWITQ
jgi:hypothetical protein